MSHLAPGGGVFHHRARLFPLPFITATCPPPATASHRVRVRAGVKRSIAAVTNRCISTLNRMYTGSSLYSSSFSSFLHSASESPPEIISSHAEVRRGAATLFAAPPSTGQLRIIALLRARCASFVTAVRFGSPPTSAAVPEKTALSLLESVWADTSAQHTTSTESTSRRAGVALNSGLSFAPKLSSYSSASTAVVPLIAARISLPDSLKIVPLERVLPAAVSACYIAAAAPSLMRPPLDLLLLNASHPLKRPKVAGSREEYIKTIVRMHSAGMLGFTSQPRAVNGVFAVAKDADTDRIIIDAQPANRLFINSPHVSLPNPSHLVQLQLPKGALMFSAKSDLKNYYHILGLPVWMQPFFALPPLSPAEMQAAGLPAGGAFPMCLTLPMGFSHAVYLAQTAHEEVVYGSGALQRHESLLHTLSPTVTNASCVHGIVIDDFFIFGLDRGAMLLRFNAVLEAYRVAGFIVHPSKVVPPTLDPLKIIGFDIDGRAGTITLPVESMRSLHAATVSLLREGCSSSTRVAHVIGRWTWLMMLRRPSLAVLQHVYRWIQVARGPRFILWQSVRTELNMLLGLMPLLSAHLHEPIFQHVVASDASEDAAGVVSTPLTPVLHATLWPLCSSRHSAVMQTQLNGERGQRALAGDVAPMTTDAELSSIRTCMEHFQQFYDSVTAAPWRTLISSRWHKEEHINALELRAALLAVHWALSFPSALGTRMYLLLDSTVSLFSLWKGRSSSPKLLLILRRISALLLAGGLSLLCGWIPSAVNPADAPSRLRAPSSPAPIAA